MALVLGSGLGRVLKEVGDAQTLQHAEQRAGAAAYWLLVEAGVIPARPAPVFWSLSPDGQAPYIKLAKFIIEREKIAYQAGERSMMGAAAADARTLDDVIFERDAAEQRLEEARGELLELREKVFLLETQFGIRQADAAFEAVETTLEKESPRGDSFVGAIIPERKAESE